MWLLVLTFFNRIQTRARTNFNKTLEACFVILVQSLCVDRTTIRRILSLLHKAGSLDSTCYNSVLFEPGQPSRLIMPSQSWATAVLATGLWPSKATSVTKRVYTYYKPASSTRRTHTLVGTTYRRDRPFSAHLSSGLALHTGNLPPLPIAESSTRIKAVIWEGMAGLQETHAAGSALQLQYKP